MESTSNNPKIEKLQELKEQMIQRSKRADSPEEGRFFLCQADLYALAIQHENTSMYGTTMSIRVGSDDDAVSRVGIEVRYDFKNHNIYFEVSFGMWKAITPRITNEVSKKRFSSAEEAFDFINGLARKINMFFNGINL